MLEPVEIGKFGDARAKSILKSGSKAEEKKKKVRMLFPIDSMTNVWEFGEYKKLLKSTNQALHYLSIFFLAMLVALQLTPVSEGLTRSFGIAAA